MGEIWIYPPFYPIRSRRDDPPPPARLRLHPKDPLQDSLQNWRGDGQLIQATEFRERVLPFLKNSLPIYDSDRLSPGTVKYFLNQGVVVIDFENADTGARNPIFNFARNEANANFLEALLHLNNDDRTQRSEILIWEKTANLWLRQNEQSIIDQLQPGPNYHELVKSAAIFLTLVQQMLNKTQIPNDELDYCQFVLQPIEIDKYSALGTELSSLARDLPTHLDSIRDFIISEVSLRQGSGGDNFIDPEPIIEGVKAAATSIKLPQIPETLFSGRFASRYQPLQIINKWSAFPELIEKELSLISSELDELRSTLAKRGCIAEDESVPIKQYFNEVLELDAILREVEISYNEENWVACKEQIESGELFSAKIAEIEEVIANPRPETQLQVDVQHLKETKKIIEFCEFFLDRTEQDLNVFISNEPGAEDAMAKSDQNKELIDKLLTLVTTE